MDLATKDEDVQKAYEEMQNYPRIIDWVDKWAEERPDDLAIIEYNTGDEITWKDFKTKTMVFAAKLLEMGVKKGDVVATTLVLLKEHIFLMHACYRIGAIIAPLLSISISTLNLNWRYLYAIILLFIVCILITYIIMKRKSTGVKILKEKTLDFKSIFINKRYNIIFIVISPYLITGLIFAIKALKYKLDAKLFSKRQFSGSNKLEKDLLERSNLLTTDGKGFLQSIIILFFWPLWVLILILFKDALEKSKK